MATYGGESKRFPSNIDPGKQFYVTVDSETGLATYYEDKGPFPSLTLGTKEPGGEFQPSDALLFSIPPVFNDQQLKEFLSEDNQKKLDQQAYKAAVEGNKAAGETEEGAKRRASQLLDPDGTGAIDPPGATDEEAAAASAQESIDKANTANQELRDSVNEKSGTKKGAGSFGDYSYPVDRNKQQDFIKFTLLEYKAKAIGSGGDAGGFGFADRNRVGPDGKNSAGRTILGTVSLPIPGGIKDENGADWAGKSMNELEIQGAAIARAALGQGEENLPDAAKALAGRISGNSEDVKKAIAESMAGKAVGVQNLMTRTTGMIFNPNLELLFDKPTLRGFQFRFDLSPRSKSEADEVIEIIKFFKQGMAPIRSESNLFLLSPHVFQVHYILNGDGTKDHPYIGKMKECAMTNFSVDYTPQQNYSTLKDGYMTAYRISMQLKELEPVFNDNYKDEVGSIGF